MPHVVIDSPNISYQGAPGVTGGSYTENKLQRLKIPSLQGKRFLDLGCNTGFYCNFARTQGARRSVGIDIDSVVITEARKSYPDVEFLDTGWDALPEGEFDVIIFLSAIHYATDPIGLVNNIRTHLASNGLLIIEGGLIDFERKFKTDILIPGWRKVGDRCRHLSGGFLSAHLLREFDWTVIGPSEPRGGDNVPRHVIHAVPGKASREQDCYQLDVVEYVQGLGLSAETIVPEMPSYSYVRQLGQSPNITPDEIASVLATESHFSAFITDLLFAIGARRPMNLAVHKTVPEVILGPIVRALREVGVATQYAG